MIKFRDRGWRRFHYQTVYFRQPTDGGTENAGHEIVTYFSSIVVLYE